MTEFPSYITYSSVFSRDSVIISLSIAALNGLSTLGCDIQNTYLTALCHKKIWTAAGSEFGSEAGKNMLVVRALYVLKFSGAAFRDFLVEALYDLGYKSSVAYPDVWMRPSIKEKDGLKYWEYVLLYLDYVLCISDKPIHTMKGIQSNFKLKDDKVDKTDVYLSAEPSTMDNEQWSECWAMLSDKYCAAMVKNFEDTLAKKFLRLTTKCNLPTKHSYRSEMDCTGDLKVDGLQWYQELIGSLSWEVDIGRFDILLQTAILSKHLALPRESHLEQVLNIVRYLKTRNKLQFLFDSGYPATNEKLFKKYDWFDIYRDLEEAIPLTMPEARRHGVIVTCFLDDNHGGILKDQKSQKGVLIFINKAPIYWYITSQTMVEASTLGAELSVMNTAVEMIETLRYKLSISGIPVE